MNVREERSSEAQKSGPSKEESLEEPGWSLAKERLSGPGTARPGLSVIRPQAPGRWRGLLTFVRRQGAHPGLCARSLWEPEVRGRAEPQPGQVPTDAEVQVGHGSPQPPPTHLPGRPGS